MIEQSDRQGEVKWALGDLTSRFANKVVEAFILCRFSLISYYIEVLNQKIKWCGVIYFNISLPFSINTLQYKTGAYGFYKLILIPPEKFDIRNKLRSKHIIVWVKRNDVLYFHN